METKKDLRDSNYHLEREAMRLRRKLQDGLWQSTELVGVIENLKDKITVLKRELKRKREKIKRLKSKIAALENALRGDCEWCTQKGCNGGDNAAECGGEWWAFGYENGKKERVFGGCDACTHEGCTDDDGIVSPSKMNINLVNRVDCWKPKQKKRGIP